MATATRALLFTALGVALDLPAAPVTTEADTAASGGAAEVEARTLARFQARDDEPVRSFRGHRRMRAEGVGRRAALDVLVELDPESGFRWTIEAESGSKLVGDKAFRSLLEEEAAVRGTAGPDGGALTSENYDLSTDGRETGGLVRLRAVPRRRDRRLLDGIVVVTANDADIVRVEGRLARNPSFWLTRVDLVRRFRRLNGHRVVVRVESVAHIRFLGDVRLTVDFDYETIDGDPIRSPPWKPSRACPGESGDERAAQCPSSHVGK
jgi:hypothetical protein